MNYSETNKMKDFQIKQLQGLNNLNTKQINELYFENTVMTVTLAIVLIINVVSIFI